MNRPWHGRKLPATPGLDRISLAGLRPPASKRGPMAPVSAPRRYRPRVVPRGDLPSRTSRIRWDRVGRVVLVVAIFAVLVSYIGPTLNVFETWRESSAAESRLGELKAENEQLSRQASALQEPAAMIAEARKLGLVAPGEQAYVVDGLK